MKYKRLALPAILVVTQLAVAGCNPSPPNDAGADVGIQCGPVVLADGGVQCVGGTTEEFCVGPLSGCTVADGGAPATCCELVG